MSVESTPAVCWRFDPRSHAGRGSSQSWARVRRASLDRSGTSRTTVTGQTFGQMALAVIPRQEALLPVGKSLYQDRADQRTTQAGDGVQQGYLEGSNVDSLQELVQMITVERSFTATQKALSGIGRLQENLITNILR